MHVQENRKTATPLSVNGIDILTGEEVEHLNSYDIPKLTRKGILRSKQFLNF